MKTFADLPPVAPGIPLSYGLENLLAKSFEQEREGFTVQHVAEAALRLYPEKVVKENLEDLALRFTERIEKLAEEAQTGPPSAKPKTRSIGSNLQDWAVAMTPTSVCLYLADYDTMRAHELYWRADIAFLEVALNAKLEFESVTQTNRFEAVLFGFGGKYADEEGASSDDGVVAMDPFADTAAGALQGFGFGLSN